MGDIHGNVDAWKDVLQQIQFRPNDELWLLGDVIDRNPGGLSIIREVMRTDNMHMLLGNHEHMMIKALNMHNMLKMSIPVNVYDNTREVAHWFQNGGAVTYDEYESLTHKERIELATFLLSLEPAKTLESEYKPIEICHAAPVETFSDRKGLHLSNQFIHCLWDRESYQDPVDIGKTVIFGHTPTMFIKDDMSCNSIIHLENDWHAIDCGAAYPIGRLACIRVDDMQEFYSYTRMRLG